MPKKKCVENCKANSSKLPCDSTTPEKTDDDEKKGRRSSILKPQKPRNPLSDLDLGNEETQDDDTATLSRTSRRVSFAPSNFVKQFAHDPEKNTIWDSTYEESIEKSSDHSPNLYIPEVSVLREEDMDITMGKENVQIESSPNMLNLVNISENKENLVNNMEFTVIVGEKPQHANNVSCSNSTIVADTEVLSSNRFFECRNLSGVNDQAAQMEFTEVLPVLCQNKANDDDVEMEFTGILHKNNPPALSNNTIHFDTSIQNDSNLIETLVLNMENNAVADELTKVNSKGAANHHPIPQSDCLVFIDKNSLVKKNSKVLSKIGVSDDVNTIEESSKQAVCADSNKSKNSTQTLLSSFHGSLSEFPSCDDTEHLINYNLNVKNQPKSDFSKIIANEYDPTFLNSKYLPLDINSESFRVSLNTIDSSSKQPETETKGEVDNRKDLSEKSTSVIDLISLTSISQRIDLENSEANISQTSINLASSDIETEKGKDSTADSFIRTSQEGLIIPELHKQNYTNVIERVKKNLAYKKRVCQIIEKKLEEFQTQLTNQNKENGEEVDSWVSDSSVEISIDVEHCNRRLSYMKFLQDKELSAFLSLKEQVEQLHKRGDSYWNIISLEDGIYKFDALCKTVTFTIELNENDGEVLHTKFEEDMTKHYDPIILYLRKVFLDRLSSSSLHSALGEKFDVLSFLDYMEITIQKVANMKKDFDELAETYAVIVDSNFSVRFTVVSIKLEQIWEFHFNIYDLNNICDNTVNVNVKMGHLSNSNVRKCLKGSPKGFEFIRAFIENVYDLLHGLEQKNFAS